MPLTEGSEHTTAWPAHQQVSLQLHTKLGNKCLCWGMWIHCWRGEVENPFPEAHTQVSYTQQTPHISFHKENYIPFPLLSSTYKMDQNKKQSLHSLNSKDHNTRFGVVRFISNLTSRDWKVWCNLKTFASQNLQHRNNLNILKGRRKRKGEEQGKNATLKLPVPLPHS